MLDYRELLMRAVHRRYIRDLMAAMAGYAGLMCLSIWLLMQVEGTALRAVVALLPMLPLGWAACAMARAIRDSDELERRIELRALSFAALLVCAATFALGLLGAAGVLRPNGTVVLLWVMPVYMLLYGTCKGVVYLRYR